MKIGNPFITRGYAGPEYFCDRDKETTALVEALRNGRDVTLVAPRRYGKTGLIHNAFGKLGNDFAAIYLDIFAIEDFTTFVRKFSSAILGRLDSRTERMGKKVFSFFKSCRPTMTPQENGSFTFSFSLAPEQAEATLEETFAYIAAHDRKVAIAIDEFQQIRQFPERSVEAFLRSHIQFVPNAHFVFAGSQKHMMDEMFVSPKAPFYQSTQLMSLDIIPENKYLEFARHFFEGSGRVCLGEAFHHLYAAFDGVTWYVQMVLNRIWTSGEGIETPNQVDAFADAIVEESAMFFTDLLNSQTPAERALLKAIGREGVVGEISASAFVARNGLPSPSTIRSAMKNLLGRDLIYKSDRGYMVYDRFLGRYLAQRAC